MHTHTHRHHTTTPHPPAADFYYELGVQVVEACITARPFTGGLMDLGLVHKYVQVGAACCSCLHLLPPRFS